MALDFNIPKLAFSLPWFMYDIGNKQLIVSKTIPEDITDDKEVVLVETPIPGLNSNPVTPGGGGVRKISFTIPIINRNNSIGNLLLLKQFANLRNQNKGLTGIFASQFTPNPQVLYYWGTGSVPLIYSVKVCKFVHNASMVNVIGNPQYTGVSLELWLDETSVLYKAEEIFRKVLSVTGTIINTYELVNPKSGRSF